MRRLKCHLELSLSREASVQNLLLMNFKSGAAAKIVSMRHQICTSLLLHVHMRIREFHWFFSQGLNDASGFQQRAQKLEISSFPVNRKNNIANGDNNYLSTCIDLLQLTLQTP